MNVDKASRKPPSHRGYHGTREERLDQIATDETKSREGSNKRLEKQDAEWKRTQRSKQFGEDPTSN